MVFQKLLALMKPPRTEEVYFWLPVAENDGESLLSLWPTFEIPVACELQLKQNAGLNGPFFSPSKTILNEML